MDARPATDNPLGLNLDFLYGRGFLWAEHENVTDWVTLEKLRMEIPDLSFPFDVRGGLSRFRDTRCTLRELDLRVSEVGLVEALRNIWSGIEGFSDLDVRFLNGVILFATRVRAFGSDTFVTFRLGAMPGEPGSDVVRLLAHEFRAYGPLPCSARQLVHTLLKRAVASEQIGAVGHGTSYSVELRGESVLLRPLKLVLLHVFAQHGWKLPNLSRVVMGDLLCRPGGAILRARSVDEDWTRDKSTGDGSPYLAAALAADEARSLFERGDTATYAGRNEEALRSYQSFQDRYGTHPGLVERLLDVLLLDPNPANLAEASALCTDLEARDGRSLVAAMGRARLADMSKRPEDSAKSWAAVSEILKARGESLDRTLCDVVVARHESNANPQSAVDRLTEALRAEPRNRAALLELQAVYERTGRDAELEGVLKRLTGVAPDNDALVDTYVALARHLMGRQGQIAEARAFLERALRVAPNRFEILDALGETWVQSGDPARAVKTLGSAATAARQRGDFGTASRLLFRIGQLWDESLGNLEQALMQIRRALDLWDEGGVKDPVGHAEQLRFAASLCERDRQQSEAIAYWTEALAALQLAEAQVDTLDRVEVRRALAETHRDIAAAYRARGRHEVAASHERRLVEMDPTDVEALDVMEHHHREREGLGSFVDTLTEAVTHVGPTPESLAMRTRLAERLYELDRADDAIEALDRALDVAPGSERVRRLLASILIEENRPAELLSRLETLRHRAHQRDAKWAIAVEMGDLALDIMRSEEDAVHAYADAAALLPARREGYVRCRFVLERLAKDRGWNGQSPLGGTLAEDLIALWQEFASAAPSHAERSKIRGELNEIAAAIGDEASEAALAWSLAEEALDEPPSGDIGAIFEDSWSEADEMPAHHEFERDAETRSVTNAALDVRDQTAVPWADEPAGGIQAAIETLEVSRIADPLIGDLTSIGEASSASDLVAPPDVDGDDVFANLESNPRLVVDAAPLQEDGGEALGFNTLEGSDPVRRPTFSNLLTLKQAEHDLAEFREQLDASSRKPPEMPDLDTVEPESVLGRVLQRSGKTGKSAPVTRSTEVPKSGVTSSRKRKGKKKRKPGAESLEALEQRLSTARKDGDDAPIADALEELLAHGDLAQPRRIDLTFELAELVYYELEDGDRALPWLLDIRRLDPTGYGSRPGVLNAIEAIYDERGSVDGQIEVLEARLEGATNEDLRDTFRLLLAQLEWEGHQDSDAAAARLTEVLARDDHNEGALRLLAEIAEAQERWVDAVTHLEAALSVAGDGLDSVELEKRLAHLYLDRVGDADAALRHFERVRLAAPQDASAMEGVRRCLAAQGDWQHYLASLREELRLLLGVTLQAEPADPADWLEQIHTQTVPKPLRVPASHVLADIARVLQDELDQPEEARQLWSKVVELWPDHIEAVERRIDLDQKLAQHGDS